MDPDSSTMKKLELQNKNEEPQKPNTDCLQLATEDSDRKCKVPIGPRFQADVPAWTDPSDKEESKIMVPDSLTMTKLKLQNKNEEPQKPNTNWLQLATDDSDRKCKVRVGPRFQANVPAWTDPSDKEESKFIYLADTESLCLESMVWSAEYPILGVRVGAGRPNFCACDRPGSTTCVQTHVSAARRKLYHELDDLFYEWKFNKMGEEFAKFLTEEEKAKFKYIRTTDPIFLHGKKPVTESIFGQALIDYYFNIYIPRKMRTSNYTVNTDDEGEEGEGETSGEASSSGSERPRENELVKSKYLTGRR